MKAEKLLDKDAKLVAWLKDGDNDKLLGSIDNHPSVGDKTFDFDVYKTIDVQDYQELAFLIGWTDIRDGFYDPRICGADWAAVREKYRLAARYAPSRAVFARVMRMMYGEIDGSHLGFSFTDESNKRWNDKPQIRGWTIFTGHLGVHFDAAHRGCGWLVKDVIPGTPADKGEKGLLPGDLVLSVDARKVAAGMDYADVMNPPLPHKSRLVVQRNGKNLERTVEAISFTKARRAMRDAEVAKIRERLHSQHNFGYLCIDSMDDESANEFEDRVFAECFGRDGVIVDVRFNSGGHTADRLIDILIEEGVKIVFTSAGSPKKYTARLHEAGMKVAHVVSSSKFARKCEEAGVDAVVAEGFEAGGHNGREETTTLTLIPQVRAATSLPLIAAGGIGSGEAMLAAMALGAEGVQIGTLFALSQESSASDAYKQRCTTLEEGDTMLTLKLISPTRLVKNALYSRILEAEKEGAAVEDLRQILGKAATKRGIFEGDVENGELEIGQIASAVKEIKSVADIMATLEKEFDAAQARVAQL